MRTGGRDLVETTFSLDIRPLVRAGAIGDDVHADGKMKLGLPDDDDALTIAFEVMAPSPIGGSASGANSLNEVIWPRCGKFATDELVRFTRLPKVCAWGRGTTLDESDA